MSAPLPAAARQLTPERRRLNRERQRRWQRRQRNGAAILRIEILDYYGLVGELIDLGWLLEAESDDRRHVERACAAVLSELAGHRRI